MLLLVMCYMQRYAISNQLYFPRLRCIASLCLEAAYLKITGVVIRWEKQTKGK